MELNINYLSGGLGRLIKSSDFSAQAWNRICDLFIGLQSDADIKPNTVTVEWSVVLAGASGLAELRQNFKFRTNYNEQAREQLLKFRHEVEIVRAAQGTLAANFNDDDIPNLLLENHFSRRQLKTYQVRDLCRLLALANGANFSVPGAGKTTVAFATHLLSRKPETKLLVVAPLNAFSAWDEVLKDCLDSEIVDRWKFTRLVGGRESIKDALRGSPMRMIINYEQLTSNLDILINLLSSNQTHMILDESHRMKAGDKSLRGSALLRLAHLPIRRDILSGTPIPRSIEDIGPQLDFLWPGQGIGWKAVSASKPGEVLKPLYVRTTKHELGLNPVIRDFIQVEMSAPQIALYSIVRKETLKRLAGIRVSGNIDLRSARSSVTRLLQTASNPILVVRTLTEQQPETFRYDDPKIAAIFGAIVDEQDSPKVKKACSLAKEILSSGERVVIWSSFTKNIDRLTELLSDFGATFIRGGVPAGDENNPDTREGRIKMFHDDESGCRVLVANPAACSEGISLHKVCHHAIYLDRSFNAAHYLQSVDRIHRLGLKPDEETYIHVLESVAPNVIGSIDYSVRRRLIDKLQIMSDALEDQDLRQLAYDEDDADAPLDYDITLEDMADIIDELEGKASLPLEDEAL